MTERQSRELTLVAYFLSRCGAIVPGKRSPAPPRVLGVQTWNRAYAMFYGRLGAGRTFMVFRNSLRNARDDFDGHLDSGRIGWRAKGTEGDDHRPPRPLPKQKQDAVDTWRSRSDDELWRAVRQFADDTVQFVGSSVLLDLAAELDPEKPAIIVRTEGGRKVIVSIRVERDPSLRAAAIKLHGTTCMVCGFSFAEMYGAWGAGFAVVHHLQPLGGSESDTRETDPAVDLAVLCANCHCMVHRKRNVALTLDELRAKLRCAFPLAVAALKGD
jgi:5-methylcytosine-specific restriction protein A